MKAPTEDLLEQIIALFQASSWEEVRQCLEQRPELLLPKTDRLIRNVVMSLQNEQIARMVEEHRVLLTSCRELGIKEALRRLPVEHPQFLMVAMRTARASQRDQTMEMPAGYEADLAEVQVLEAQRQRDPRAITPLIEAYNRILKRLGRAEHPNFHASILINLGSVPDFVIAVVVIAF